MKTRILNIWDSLRTSYWFLPSLLGLLATLLSFSLPELDNALEDSPLPNWLKTTPAASRALLSAISGIMPAVAGTVFSITIVTLCLASQQFGPRLLRTFMSDVPTQLTLGIFLSTAVYSLLLLRIIEADSNSFHPPHLSVLAAVVMVLISIIMLIYFVHHVAQLIQAPRIVSTVGRELDEALDRLYPASPKLPSPHSVYFHCALAAHPLTLSKEGAGTPIGSEKEGYLQAVSLEDLVRLAQEANVVVYLSYMLGDFVVRDAPIGRVVAGAFTEELARRVNANFIVGERRTPRQDITCSIQELVEVAVRSLSPGTNDPFTAVHCIDVLSAALQRLAVRDFPSPYQVDGQGELRVVLIQASFPSVLDNALNQIRQHAESSVAVMIRLLELLERVANVARRVEDIDAVQRHTEMISRQAARCVSEQGDLDDIHRHVQQVKETSSSRGLR